MDLEEFADRRRQIESLKLKLAREQGRHGERLRRIKELTGTDDLKRAGKFLAKRQRELAERSKEIGEGWRLWDERWSDKLEET